MNRLVKLFKEKSKNILNIYFTAGHPHLEGIKTTAVTLAESGVDIIELGMPYSDPMADGETIQKSSSIALGNGMNLNIMFDSIKDLRKHTQIPIVLMGYYNQVIQYGEMDFFKACQDSGVDGLILPDLPLDIFEEKYVDIFKQHNLVVTFLVTPQTSDIRIQKAANLSNGFLYVVSSSSITGNKKSIELSQTTYFDRVNKLKGDTPSLIGFGIHDSHTFKTACNHANGAIIGSAFIRDLEKHNGSKESIATFIASIRS